MLLNAATEAAHLSSATMEDRADFLAGSGSNPPEACNLCAVQNEGPESGRKQLPAQEQRIHPLSATQTLGRAVANGRNGERSISAPSPQGPPRHRSSQVSCRKNVGISEGYRLFTRSAQSSVPENIDPERMLTKPLAPALVLSPSRITLENNGKIRPQPDRENAFVGASGGGGGRHVFFQNIPTTAKFSFFI